MEIRPSLYTKQFIQLLTKSGKRIKPYTWKNRDGIINIDNHKIYVRYLDEKLGYRKMEDWYKITHKDLRDNYGAALVNSHYNGSPSQFVMAMFPDYEWFDWKFDGGVGRNYWTNANNHKRYAEWLGKVLGYTKMEDWYKITLLTIQKNYGYGLMGYYNGSPIQFVMAMFPDYKWLEWKFGHVPNNFWEDEKNHKIYAEWLGKELGFIKMEDWYKITCSTIHENYGGGLFSHYNDSPIQFVKAMFPDYEWLEWKFGVASNGFWNDKNNHKIYAEWLGKELGFIKMEDWYKITHKNINENGGNGLIKNYYNHSASQFVKAMFPDYEWLEWKFGVASNGFWKDKNNHKRYAEWLGEKLGYTKKEDWYTITRSTINENYGGGLMPHYYNSSRSQFVMAVFPDFKWEKSKFKKGYSHGQIQWLEYLMIEMPDIRHILNHNNKEFYVPGSREFCEGGVGYHTDGFSETEHKIYEYMGDFWHGNPAIYNPDDINSITKTTFGEIYNKELKRRKFCEDSGFKYHSIWESEWHRGIRAIVQLQKKMWSIRK